MHYIKINRLAVYKHGKVAYDQIFHDGVNIIRGINGSGKSTIANFIYYILGGDFTNWLPEASTCDYAIAEINVNNKVLTMKRAVESQSMQPMDIYFGSFENAIRNSIEGWNRYSFKRSENKDSFSQVLFKYLDYTEISTENGDFLTFNQILRLLYIDQITPVNNIIKSVDFDSPIMRKTIGYYLYGSHDDSLLKDERDIRLKKRDLNDLQNQQRIFIEILNGKVITSQEIDKEIGKLSSQLEKIDTSIENSSTAKDLAYKQANNKFNDKKNELIGYKNKSIQVGKEINSLKIDINDSIDFINELKQQSKSLNTSIITRSVIGLMPVSHCPSCLSKLSESPEHNICAVCGNEHEDDTVNKAVKIKEEIDNQIKESEKIYNIKINRLTLLEEDEKTNQMKYQDLQKEVNNTVKNATTSFDQELSQLYTKKGEIRINISQLFEKKKNVFRLEEVTSKIKSIKYSIEELQTSIERKSKIQRINSNRVFDKINEYAIEILKSDSEHNAYESSFTNATRVAIDYDKNTFLLDGRGHFSASSMVILKNAIRFAIFFASLDLKFMRFPRFILCDNIEDKGMVEARSHQFQKTIVSIAERFDKSKFQIIFTTSMLDPSLDINELTVGPSYSGKAKTLYFEPSVIQFTTGTSEENTINNNLSDEFLEDLGDPF